MKESKSEKFIRLAESRVTKTLNELRIVGNLCAPAYEYTKEQVRAILTVLEYAVEDINLRFGEPGPAENEDFKFVDWIQPDDSDDSDDSVGFNEDDDDIETIIHNDETG